MKFNKKGNILIVFLSVFVIVLMILIFFIYIAYTQINVMIYPIKQDIFYIVQNSYFSLDQEKFKFYEYEVSEEELKEKIMELVYLNHKDKVCINSIYYDKNNNRVKINYNIIIPTIVFKSVLGDTLNFNLSDDIKLKSMEVR